jgi:hypothetical protein
MHSTGFRLTTHFLGKTPTAILGATHDTFAINTHTQENRYGFPTLLPGWQDINDINSFRNSVPNDLRVVNGPRKTNKKDKDSRHLLGVNWCDYTCACCCLVGLAAASQPLRALQQRPSYEGGGPDDKQGAQHRHRQEPRAQEQQLFRACLDYRAWRARCVFYPH